MVYKSDAALLNRHRTDSVVGVALSRSLGDKLAKPVNRRFREKLGSWAGPRTLSHSHTDVLTTSLPQSSWYLLATSQYYIGSINIFKPMITFLSLSSAVA